ncbi:MAG: peptide ABC transporter substrate-binding protein [Acholeplasmataceae bacterium]
MKKLFLLILLIVGLVTVAACNGEDPVETIIPTVEPTPTPTPEPTPTPTEEPIVPVLANGEYNFKFADAELRHTFFAAAERHLLLTMQAGVPLFANAGFVLYSSRMQLASEESLPVLGFGVIFSTMSADDSTVLMDDDTIGNAGEYTYRSSLAQNPDTLHHWIYTDATSSDVITLFTGALYSYQFNDAKDGYVLAPSLAAADPVPLNSEVLDSGKEVSKTWRISIRDDITWAYNANTDTSSFPAGHENITAHDFINTYKLAIDQGWFRATAGGGHFWANSQEIVNAKAYRDFVSGVTTEEVDWADVGMKVIDDYTFEFEFVSNMSQWNVKYWLGSFVMSPINLHLYEALGGAENENNLYGTSPETTAYTGQFVLDVFEQDKILRYSKNPDFVDADLYFYTHYSYVVIEDAEIRFQEFLAGKLDGIGLPTPRYDSFKNHPGLKRVPGATTFRLMINGLGTVEAQREQFPDGSHVPEPLLANLNFKRAMFFAVDRQFLAEEVLKTSQTQMYLFTDAYLVEAESGVPFRATPQGDTVSVGLSPSTNGFNFDAAQALYKQALDELIASGDYAPGTAANPTVIDLSLYIFSGSEAQVLFGEYMKTAYEAAFNDTDRHIKVTITPIPRQFPGIYFDYMMTGEFDLAIGGISGSTLDASSFLDTYTSDNRSGFTLNWGIDTNIPEIEVTYTNAEGVTLTEIWSFNAIMAALNGDAYVVDGQEAELPEE